MIFFTESGIAFALIGLNAILFWLLALLYICPFVIFEYLVPSACLVCLHSLKKGHKSIAPTCMLCD